MIVMGIYSDRHKKRRIHLIACAALTALGFILSVAFEHSLPLSLAALSLATMGVLSSVVVFWSIPTKLLSGRAAAGGIALINSIGGLGGYAGPAALGWIKDTTTHIESGLLLLSAAQVVAIVLITQLKL